MNTTCETVRELLSPFMDGELARALAGEVERHLEQCPRCREEMAGLRLTIQVLASVPSPALSADLSARAVERASMPRWREMWASIRASLAPRGTFFTGGLARAAAVFALFLLAATAPDSELGSLVSSWPRQVAGVAGTGAAYVTSGLSRAQAVLDERIVAATAQGTARR